MILVASRTDTLCFSSLYLPLFAFVCAIYLLLCTHFQPDKLNNRWVTLGFSQNPLKTMERSHGICNQLCMPTTQLNIARKPDRCNLSSWGPGVTQSTSPHLGLHEWHCCSRWSCLTHKKSQVTFAQGIGVLAGQAISAVPFRTREVLRYMLLHNSARYGLN